MITTSSFIATVAIYALVIYFVWRNNPKSIGAALGGFGGLLILAYLGITTMTVWAPRHFATSVPVVQENYQPIFDMAAQTGMSQLPNKAASLLGFLSDSYSAGPTTDFVTGETAETAVTQPTPDPNAGGGVPDVSLAPAVIADVPAIAPAPQPTPDPAQAELTALYKRLDVAKNSNDRAALDSVLVAILAINENDAVALEVQLDLQAAQQKEALLQSLAQIPLKLRKFDAVQSNVHAALRGGTFRTVDNGASLTNFACQELATIEVVTSGFLYGSRFQVPRCYLEDYRGHKAGSTFQVN